MKIIPLKKMTASVLKLLKSGYSTQEIYTVVREGDRERITFTLEMTPLPQPYVKDWGEAYTTEGLKYYQRILDGGWSWAVQVGEELAAVAICEPRRWNKSLFIYEFHVTEAFRRQGIGQQLMEHLAQEATVQGLRIMVCEVQNTNVPALDFYRSAGFELDALDLTLYANNPGPRGEMAFFMKRKLKE